MPSHGNVILQSTLLKTAANLTVQAAKIWSHNDSAIQGIEWLSVAEFAVCGVIQAEIGWHWHNFLEDTFPSQPEPPNEYEEKQKHQERKEYWLHIFLKLMLDQTAGIRDEHGLHHLHLRRAGVEFEYARDRVG